MENKHCIVTGVLFLFCYSCAGACPTEPRAQERRSVEEVAHHEKSSSRPTLELSAETNKRVYKKNERIALEVKLTNTSKAPIYVYGLLERGFVASLQICVFDEKGKRIFPKLMEDSVTVAPRERTEFVILYPDHFFGIRSTEGMDDWNVNTPGKYKIIVEYHSPIPKDYGLGLEIWSTESGPIFSKTIEIEVVSPE